MKPRTRPLGLFSPDYWREGRGNAHREASFALPLFRVGGRWEDLRLLAESFLPAHHRAHKNHMGGALP